MGTTKKRSGAKAGIIVAALGTVFAGGAASAQAVSLIGTISENLAFKDNFALQNNSAGTTTSSITNFALNYQTSTAASSLTLYASTDLVFRADPGGSTNVDPFNPYFSVDYTRTGQSLTFNVGAFYSDTLINFQTAPPGSTPPPGGTLPPLITSTSKQRDYAAYTGLVYQISATDSLDGTLRFSGTDFDAGSAGLFDYSTSAASLTWTRDINARLTTSIDANLGVFLSDDPINDRTRAVGVGIGATWDRTNNVTLDGRLAVAYSVLHTPIGNTESTDFLGNLGITYTLPTGSVSASIREAYVPGATGELLLSSNFNISGTYNINSTSQFDLNFDYALDETVFSGVTSEAVTITPSYSISLTSSVTASTGYTMTTADFGSGRVVSHEVYFDLIKTFNLLP